MATVYYALENVFPKRTDSINKQISPRLSYRKHVNKGNSLNSGAESLQSKVGTGGDGGLLGRRLDSPVSLIFSEPPGARASTNSEELNDRSSLKLSHSSKRNRGVTDEGSGTPLRENFDNRSDQGRGGDDEDKEGRTVFSAEEEIHNVTEEGDQCEESPCLRFEREEIEKTTNKNDKENTNEKFGDEHVDKVSKENSLGEKSPIAEQGSDDVTYDEEDQNLYGDLLLQEYRKYFNDFNLILSGDFYGGKREKESAKSVSRNDSQNRKASSTNHVQDNVDEKSEIHDNLTPSLKILSEGIGRRILSEGMGSYELESKSHISAYGAFKPDMSQMFTKTKENHNKLSKGGRKKNEAMSQAVSSRKINVSKVHGKERMRGSVHSSHDLNIGAAALPTHQMPDYTLRSKFKGFLNRRESSKFPLAVQLEVQDKEQSANRQEGRVKPSVRFILD